VDIDTGRVLNELHGHSRTVESVSFHPDGRILASASHDETIKLWDVVSQAAAGSEACLSTLRAPGPYIGMSISGVTGITEGQKATLIALGAVEDDGAA
jgi:WD40 repeat protein